ncbi:MAG: alpha-galactosidase [Clostridia bacterium]|nr:alpha-galactosidase [Clostridia bacterium]
MSIFISSDRHTFYLSGGNTTYLLHIDEENRLLCPYWGVRLPDGSFSYDSRDYFSFASFDLPVSRLPFDIPTCGSGWYGTPAVAACNAHGDDVTDLRFVSFRVVPGKPSLPDLPALYAESPSEADTLLILLQDALTGLQVEASYTVFASSGAIARSLNIRNTGSGPLHLTSVQPASVPFWNAGMDVIHLKGAWARERTVVRTPVGEGEYRISSARGASGHEENPFFALCDRNTDEFSGRVWAVSFVYSGSFQASCTVDNTSHARLSIGMNPAVFSWLLNPGESFQSPEAVLAFSDAGLNGMSHLFHALYRSRLARGFWRDRSRPVLVNNWEGTYFSFTEKRLLAIAEKANEIGIELFVLDDGWFGRRNSDNCSLGDWTINRRKLPSGLSGLSEKLHAMGLRFGLWFEPEMVSPDSKLYRAHPDWCLHVPGRPRSEARNQLILDLSRSEVQEYIISSVSAVLSSASIDYVKWDMNRNMTEAFSEALPPERRMESQHRYMLGLYHVLETVTSAFPQILFESCSGGGGRFDPGMLYYMPQTWTSDDTDAVERLKLQYGTSFVYPASAMGAHVSAVPNHQTGRSVSLRMRGEVALAGNFGFELDLAKMTKEDLAEAADLVSRVKSLRDLTRTGTFWRLLSPFEGNDTAWAFVSEDRKEVLFCAYSSLSVPNMPPRRIRLKGLLPEAWYKTEDGAAYNGSVLMNVGISVPRKGDFSSFVLHLKTDN